MHVILLLLLALPAYGNECDYEDYWTGEAGRLSIDKDCGFWLRIFVPLEQEFIDELANLTQLANSGREEGEEPLAPIDEMWIDLFGQLEAAGDTLNFAVQSFEWRTNVGRAQEAFTELAWALAKVVADQAGISDEERAAFEQDFVDNFLGLMEAERGEDPEQIISHWDPRRGVIVINGHDFIRTNGTIAPSAVQRQSWGQIKQGFK